MGNTAWEPMAEAGGVQKQVTVFGKRALVVEAGRQALAEFRTKCLEERKWHPGLRKK